MLTFERAEEIYQDINERLKNVKSLKDLNWLISEVEKLDYHIVLCGKRRGYEAYAFTQHEYNPNKTCYLYADSVSTGKCEYSNLYKVLEFKVWYDGGVYSHKKITK